MTWEKKEKKKSLETYQDFVFYISGTVKKILSRRDDSNHT